MENKAMDNPCQEQVERQLRTLERVTGFINDVTDIEGLLQRIMEETSAVMESEAASCLLYDKHTDELFFQTALGEKASEVKEMRLPRGQGVAWQSLLEDQFLIVNNPKEDSHHDASTDDKAQFVTRNLIATPMRYRDEEIGVLEVLNKSNGENYTEQDARLLSMIAEQAAVAIANAYLIDERVQRERLASIGLAVSGIAHHLKNIINTVHSPIALLKMGLEDGNTATIEKAIPYIERGTNRMQQSVREMLEFSKDREPDLEDCDLRELLVEIKEQCIALCEKYKVELRFDCPDQLPHCRIDRVRIHDAVLNLLVNAIEAHGERAKPGAYVHFRIQINQLANYVTIHIIDNGPGIPEDMLKRIFEPFFSTKGSRGTGLGLAVAHKVAEQNGGCLEVESTVGEGTTFCFALPMKAEASPTDTES